jgi:hypothetical protein
MLRTTSLPILPIPLTPTDSANAIPPEHPDDVLPVSWIIVHGFRRIL